MFLSGQTEKRVFLNSVKFCSQNSSFTHCSQNIIKRNENVTLSIVYKHNLFQCIVLFLNFFVKDQLLIFL